MFFILLICWLIGCFIVACFSFFFFISCLFGLGFLKISYYVVLSGLMLIICVCVRVASKSQNASCLNFHSFGIAGMSRMSSCSILSEMHTLFQTLEKCYPVEPTEMFTSVWFGIIATSHVCLLTPENMATVAEKTNFNVKYLTKI